MRLLDKGIVVDLGDEVEGFVPVSQLGLEEEIADPAGLFVEGDALELKVLESDPINRRIVLVVTAAPATEQRIASGQLESTGSAEASAEAAAETADMSVEEAAVAGAPMDAEEKNAADESAPDDAEAGDGAEVDKP